MNIYYVRAWSWPRCAAEAMVRQFGRELHRRSVDHRRSANASRRGSIAAASTHSAAALRARAACRRRSPWTERASRNASIWAMAAVENAHDPAEVDRRGPSITVGCIASGRFPGDHRLPVAAIKGHRRCRRVGQTTLEWPAREQNEKDDAPMTAAAYTESGKPLPPHRPAVATAASACCIGTRPRSCRTAPRQARADQLAELQGGDPRPADGAGDGATCWARRTPTPHSARTTGSAPT